MFHMEHKTQKALVMSAFVRLMGIVMCIGILFIFKNTECVCESDVLSAAIM